LGALRWAEDHAVAEVIGVDTFDEDDLYAALDWLQGNQERIEKVLAPKPRDGAFFLYDVTSSYFEGQYNELAAHGYNRDGKKYKKQLVAGLLTDEEGEPVSISVHKGNTSDPVTFGPMVERVKERFGAGEVVMVGDRGMIKSKGIEQLGASGMRYVTALTNPQTRKLITEKVIDPELFDEEPAEIEHEGRRLILRLNPAVRQREQERRKDQLARLARRLEEGNAKLAVSARSKMETLQKKAQTWVNHYHFGKWLTIKAEGRMVSLCENTQEREQAELLDGCYVIVTDLPAKDCATTNLCERYMSLQKVERDFRSMKTAQLEMRPIYLRKAERTEGHAFVTMLALKLTRRLDALAAPLGLTVDDLVERLAGVRLVSLGPVPLGFWRLPDSFLHAQQQILDLLPPLPSPSLSLKKPISARLVRPRNGRPTKH
jgi:transposase